MFQGVQGRFSRLGSMLYMSGALVACSTGQSTMSGPGGAGSSGATGTSGSGGSNNAAGTTGSGAGVGNAGGPGNDAGANSGGAGGASGAGGSAGLSTGGAGGLPNETCPDDPQGPVALGGLVPLYAAADAVNPDIVTTLQDGTIITRAAGRVRGRHEHEQTFAEYDPVYFEDRSYGFIIEDFTAAGQQHIRATYLPIAAPSTMANLRTNWRAWRNMGADPVYSNNDVMDDVAESPVPVTAPVAQAQQYDVQSAPQGRSMAAGETMEFEFGIFLEAGALATAGTRTSYHSDTFRYAIGVGGLTPNNTNDPAAAGPVAEAQLGGATTQAWLLAQPELYFDQMALNIQHENAQSWLEGRRLFHTDFATGEHQPSGPPDFTAQAGKAGPTQLATSCEGCHSGGGSSAPLAGPDAAYYATRNAPALVGMGLLEAIDEQTILALADRIDCNLDGISGRPSYVMDPASGALRLGRFGWKAEKISVAHQVAADASLAMGVGTMLFPEQGNAELEDSDFQRLVRYVSLLGVPPQRDRDAVQLGAALFESVGCSSCHLPSLTTSPHHPLAELRSQSIKPFTDLLLHDMGPELADDSGLAANDAQNAPAAASEWRTPALWGIGLRAMVNGHAGLLHDGRAATVLDAIFAHGGEATVVIQNLMALPASEQEAISDFVMSL